VIATCAWAKVYYEEKIAKGKSAQMAKRALAFKWKSSFGSSKQGSVTTIRTM
jgi:hypothetical protein